MKEKVANSGESNSYRTMYPFFPIQPQRRGLLRNLCPAVVGRWVGCCRESRPSGSTWERPRRSCQSGRFYGSVLVTERNRNHKEFTHKSNKKFDKKKQKKKQMTVITGERPTHFFLFFTGRVESAYIWIADESFSRWRQVSLWVEFLPCPSPLYRTLPGRWWFAIVWPCESRTTRLESETLDHISDNKEKECVQSRRLTECSRLLTCDTKTENSN